jgi:hypothetical protein
MTPCHFRRASRRSTRWRSLRVAVPATSGVLDREHITAGLIWASLCAAVLKRFLAHAAQLIGDKPISTRRVAMCAGHIIDELVATLLASTTIVAVFRDGIAFLLANARRANPKRDRKIGRLRSGVIVKLLSHGRSPRYRR